MANANGGLDGLAVLNGLLSGMPLNSSCWILARELPTPTWTGCDSTW